MLAWALDLQPIAVTLGDINMAAIEIVEGWTSPIDFVLTVNGTTPASSMEGISVELILHDASGNIIDTTDKVDVSDIDAWIVQWSPDPGDVVPGVYSVRVKLYDSLQFASFVPNADPGTLIVYSA
jgi:hypothetical protein